MKKPRVIPTSNEIKAFFHCRNCFEARPNGVSPREWAKIECGWTELGFQAWCIRCDLNIMHVDFQGVKHPGNGGVNH